MRTVLGAQVAQRLIDLLNGQGGAGPVVPSLVNHTPPTYVADADYSETIDGVLVTYLTIAAVQNFWVVTLSLAPKHINALRMKELLIQKIWRNLTVRNSKW